MKSQKCDLLKKKLYYFQFSIGDKLFEKDAKLSLKNDQLIIIQEYFQQLLPNIASSTSSTNNEPATSSSSAQVTSDPKHRRRVSNTTNSNTNKEFLLLYKSNQLHIIQDFLFKITNLKVKYT